MANNRSDCFDKRQFQQFLENQTDSLEEATMLSHIVHCSSCQEVLKNLAGQPNVWNDLKMHLDGKGLLWDRGSDNKRDLDQVLGLLGPTDNPEMLGRLNGYEVCGVIGRGSAGIVVKALDPRLNRFVAIKLLAPNYSHSGCARRRFEREARAIASVKDPHVVPVHLVEEYQGTPYIVMQYIPNGSLHQRIHRSGPLDTTEVTCIGMQVAKGLAAAHARGIVHRDVKPANVLLENGINGAMVTDFGLARVIDEASMTRSGSISGTPQYMSPEQARGEQVDPRSDLFSLGSVMYAASTGHDPFRSDTVFGVIKRVCEDKVNPVRELNPDIAPWLAAIIDRLHEKNPQNRFESANEVAEILSQELAHLQSPTLVAQPSREWWATESRHHATQVRNVLLASLIFVLLLMSGWLAWDRLGDLFDGSTRVAHGPTKDESRYEPFPDSQLTSHQSQLESLPQFVHSTESSIDVQPGGILHLRTNLGKISISTHQKQTVELRLRHSVSASDETSAARKFEQLKIEYPFDSKSALDNGLTRGNDAIILIGAPVNQPLPELEKPKRPLDFPDDSPTQKGGRFNSILCELTVPENFNLNLQTLSGPIVVSSIDGWVKLHTQKGNVSVGEISGDTEIITQGGQIDVGKLGSHAVLHSNGTPTRVTLPHTYPEGDIWAESIAGNVDARSESGDIELLSVAGSTVAKSIRGDVTIWRAKQEVQAVAPLGSVKVNFVDQPTGDSSLSSGINYVSVGYLKGLRFDIDAFSERGTVESIFESPSKHRLQHRLNGGQNKLLVESKEGRVRIQLTDLKELTGQEDRIKFQRGRRIFQAAYQLHINGQLDEAIDANLIAARYPKQKALAYYNLGCEWSLKGESDKAFEALANSLTHGLYDVANVEKDADLQSIRGDKRYDELIAKLKQLPSRPKPDHNGNLGH